MTQSITTKYLGATDHRGERIKATATGARNSYSFTHDWDYSLGATDNHIAAAKGLVEKLEWTHLEGQWTGGGYKDGVYANGGMVFVHDSGNNFSFDNNYYANLQMAAERTHRDAAWLTS